MPISYTELSKPSEPTFGEVSGAVNHLLINATDFLLINATDKLIISKAEGTSVFDNIFTDVSAITGQSYTEVTQP